MTSLLAFTRNYLGPEKAHNLFCAEHVVRLSFTDGHNAGPVTRVTGAGPTIEAAIDAAVRKMERQQEQGRAA